MAEWKDLTRMTEGKRLVVERVRVPETGIAVEGTFDLPPLAQLTLEDQVFIATFIKTHGSIKEMEGLFGISYPTVKNRLNRISELIGYGVATETAPPKDQASVLDRLERGEITAKEALKELKK